MLRGNRIGILSLSLSPIPLDFGSWLCREARGNISVPFEMVIYPMSHVCGRGHSLGCMRARLMSRVWTHMMFHYTVWSEVMNCKSNMKSYTQVSSVHQSCCAIVLWLSHFMNENLHCWTLQIRLFFSPSCAVPCTLLKATSCFKAIVRRWSLRSNVKNAGNILMKRARMRH